MASPLSFLRRLSPPVAGALLGLGLGVVDAAYVAISTETHDATGSALPFIGWFTLVWTWIAMCAATGVVFSSPRLGKFRGAALALTGPGTFLLSRVLTPLKFHFQLGNRLLLALWVLAVVAFAIPLGMIDYARPRRYAPAVAAVLIS